MIHIERAFRRLKAAFPQSSMGQDTVAIYTEKLCKYTPEAVLRAAESCIETMDRFPTVAQLVAKMNAPGYLEPYRPPLLGWENTQHGDGCGVGGILKEGLLKGERWEPWEIQGPNGKRGFPNNLYYRGLSAMRAHINGQLAEGARRRQEHAAAAPKEEPVDDEWKS